MNMGGPKDNPITDILDYNILTFSSRVDGLVKEIAKYISRNELESLIDWFVPPSLDVMESILSNKLEKLKSDAKVRGWEV